jgi:uncharacterized protein with PQ loop repeat
LHSFLTVANAAMTAQLLLIFVALPLQIRKMHQMKTSEGLSLFFVGFPVVCNVLWAIHGWQNRDWAIFVPQVPAFLFSSVIVVLYFRYKPQGAAGTQA